MAIAPTSSLPQPARQLLSALTNGDSRLSMSFQDTLTRAVAQNDRDNTLRTEELEALTALTEGVARAGTSSQRNALEPTLRHLLARVL
jgi:hypothetical protein